MKNSCQKEINRLWDEFPPALILECLAERSMDEAGIAFGDA